jgi:hypothetical protein
MTPDAIFEHFRHRTKDEEPFEKLVDSTKCPLHPSRDLRGTSTLQKSAMSMQRNLERYGDDYYLAVFAERRWAIGDYAPALCRCSGAGARDGN